MCARDVVLAMEFFSENSAIVDFHEGIVLLSSVFPEPKESGTDRKPVHLACHHVTQPHRSAMLVSGKADVTPGIEGAPLGNIINLLL